MTDKTSGFYTSGWCGSCGRRRAADGRCLNCDAWWTSPLVQIGGPVVVLGTLLLLVSISFVRTFSSGANDMAANGGGSGAASAPITAPALIARTNASPLSPYYPSAALSTPPLPVPAMPISVSAASFAPEPPSDEELRWAAHMQLVQNAGYVDAAIRRDDQARSSEAFNGGKTGFAGGGDSMNRATLRTRASDTGATTAL